MSLSVSDVSLFLEDMSTSAEGWFMRVNHLGGGGKVLCLPNLLFGVLFFCNFFSYFGEGMCISSPDECRALLARMWALPNP